MSNFTNGQLLKTFLCLAGLSILAFGLQVVNAKSPSLFPFAAGVVGAYIVGCVVFIKSKKKNGRWW